jgi:hypothetical protein
MQQEISMKPEKLSRGQNVRELVEAVAGPRLTNDTRETWLRRAARVAGTSYRQAKALFYSEITDPYHPTITRFREAAGNHEAIELAERYERIAMALVQRDADFHKHDAAAMLAQAHALRGLVSPRNRGR